MSELNHYTEEAKLQGVHYNLKPNLKELKESGIDYLQTGLIPTRKTESWKYTNLKSLLGQNYKNSTAKSPSILSKNELEKQNIPDAYNLHFINGIYSKDCSQKCSLDITDIKDLDEDKFHNFLKRVDQDLKNDFAFKLNSAFFNIGSFISLSQSSIVDRPIIFHHHQTEESSQVSTFNIIHVEKNQSVQLYEFYHSKAKSFINPTTLFFCDEDSNAEHIIQQTCNEDALFLGQFHSSLKKNAYYQNICFHLGSKQSRCFLTSTLEDEFATTNIHGLYPLRGDQHHDSLAKIHHIAPHTYSHQLYKGILSDQSKGIFTGKIFVEREAQLTEAKQLNKNLLLGPKAHAFSRPQLEVYADDVKCAHGSTTGQLSDDELFYFEARGIKKEKARQLLAQAFAFDVVLKIKSPLFRKIIEKSLRDFNMDLL